MRLKIDTTLKKGMTRQAAGSMLILRPSFFRRRTRRRSTAWRSCSSSRHFLIPIYSWSTWASRAEVERVLGACGYGRAARVAMVERRCE